MKRTDFAIETSPCSIHTSIQQPKGNVRNAFIINSSFLKDVYGDILVSVFNF